LIEISIVQIKVEKPFDHHLNSPDRSRKALLIAISIVQMEIEKLFDQHFNNSDRSRKAPWSPQL